jgi:phosphoribosylformimino-5-aminoimidazole carboxamide ribotide isomerase
MTFTVYPAIDVRAGRVVRLRQGDYHAQTEYPAPPSRVALDLAAQGARWLHLVDLDAAREGGYTLLPLLREIVAASPLKVQTGGGVRNEADVEVLLEAGAARVVVGSVAIREPERVTGWLRTYGSDRITVALDARRGDDGQWRLPSHGWTEQSGRTLPALASDYAAAGLRHLLCTDIERDGMLAGPGVAMYQALCAALPGLRVQASGGVRDVRDIAAVREAGCAGVVVGKALLEARMGLVEAIAPC